MVTARTAGLLALALALAVAFVPAASPAKANPKLFPVRVHAANGTVTFSKRPLRIVSLSPTATEMLYAVGAGKQVVAVDSLSNYPARAPKTNMSGYKPNAEAIAGYNPDLVVVRSDGGIVSALNKLGIRVMLDPEAARLGDAYSQIVELGKATGYSEKARAIVASMKAGVAAALKTAGSAGRGLSMYHELTTDYYSAASNTFIGQIYKLFGLRNIADAATGSSAYPQLSPEYIISSNPKLIFLADSQCCGQNLSTVGARPGWSNIDAVKNGDVIALDGDVVSRWGPRIVTFVKQVAAAIHRAKS